MTMVTIGNTGTALSLSPLPVLSAGGDFGSELAVLGVESGQLEHAEATADRDAEQKLAQAEATAEVQALRSEASSIGSQAWMDGGLAAFQAAAGGKSAVLGAVVSGLKGTGDGICAADQKGDEATAKGCEAAVTAAQSGAEGAHDVISNAEQLVQSSLEFYKEYVSTTAQTRDAVAGHT
jgi:hypothetical protein